LSRNTTVGASEVEIVSCEQQTFDPGAKSIEELTSTSYFVAPGTAVHENCGSKNSVAGTRSVSTGVVAEGHDQLKAETDEGVPRLPSESTGTTFQ
jgi:hypothetical protein